MRETAAAAFVDGSAGLGAVVGQFSMQLAIQKVRTYGPLGQRNSNNKDLLGCGYAPSYRVVFLTAPP